MRRNISTWNRARGGRERTTLYYEDPLTPPHTRAINYRDYDVFISHKGDDTSIAESVGDTLFRVGLSAYLDRWDPHVSGDSPKLEEYLREIIRHTDILFAVVTENTPLSWWVPFEIGVGRETDSALATYLIVDETSSRRVILPSYLRRWPILSTEIELLLWAKQMSYGYGTFIYKAQDAMNQSRYDYIDSLEMSGKVEFV